MKARDAEDKLCPFWMFAVMITTNRPEDRPHALCIADDCMMWRWRGDEGYCGLAGSEAPQ